MYIYMLVKMSLFLSLGSDPGAALDTQYETRTVVLERLWTLTDCRTKIKCPTGSISLMHHPVNS